MEKVITLGKLIGLLFLFCLPLLSVLFLKTPKIRGMTSLVYNACMYYVCIQDMYLLCMIKATL